MKYTRRGNMNAKLMRARLQRRQLRLRHHAPVHIRNLQHDNTGIQRRQVRLRCSIERIGIVLQQTKGAIPNNILNSTHILHDQGQIRPVKCVTPIPREVGNNHPVQLAIVMICITSREGKCYLLRKTAYYQADGNC